MVLPVGESGWSQQLVRVTRRDDGYECEELLPVRFVPLVEGVVRD